MIRPRKPSAPTLISVGDTVETRRLALGTEEGWVAGTVTRVERFYLCVKFPDGSERAVTAQQWRRKGAD